jgi:two-component system cell cycle sensor histidine kinase/response regulator CckA
VTPGDYVELCVADDGIGMGPDVLGRAFEPFFTTKEVGRGTGLGLSTVYGIVMQSNGAVWAESVPDDGTRVRILLPRIDTAADPPPAPGGPPIDQGAHGAGQRILLVEDSSPVRDLLVAVLRRGGYRVSTAEHGEEALEVAEREGRPNLLLTDVVMPKMGGPALAEQLQGRWPDLPVLYMSGYTDDAILRRGITLDELAFLQKPVEPDTLLRTLDQMLGTGASAAAV